MADIILAECAARAWLVRGEQHIDHLLANTVPKHITIEVVACESKSAVDDLWRSHGGGADCDMPWLIHPAIVERVRRRGGDIGVVFAAWSAALDEAALRAVEAAAGAVAGRADAALVLIRHVPEAGPAMAMELANLRSGLIEARLASLGVAPSRMARETRPPSQPAEGERIDLVVREA